jgi:hypothetical protein
MFTGIITLLTALAISAVAAFVSVTGMMAIFPAVANVMMVAMATLEIGKLVTAHWLHSNWFNPAVSKKLRTALTAIVVVLMMITSLGIYGFLSKGYLEQRAPVAGMAIQIAQKEQEIKMLEGDSARLQTKLSQLDANIDSFLKGDKAERANSVRNRQKTERQQIENNIQQNNEKIKLAHESLLPLRVSTSEVEAKLGPIKYIAELFGWSDIGTAVRMVILMLIFVFDPLAVFLLLGASISFSDWRLRKRSKDPVIPDPVIPDPQPDAPEQPILKSELPEASIVEPEVQPVHGDQAHEPIELSLEPTEPRPPRDFGFFDAPVKKKRGGNRRKPKAIDADPSPEEVEEAYRRSLVMLADAYLNKDAVTVGDGVKLVEILEKRPELLGTLIDVIRDDQSESKAQAPEGEELSNSGESTNKSTTTDVPQAQLDQYAKQATSWLGNPKSS